MNVLYAASEAVPFVKTGGLADVVGALHEGMSRLGHETSLFIPRYSAISTGDSCEKVLQGMKVTMGDRTYYCDVFSLDGTFMVGNDYFFGRRGIYGEDGAEYPDNAERFAFFSLAVLRAANALDIRPDVMHLHDWQTGLIPFYAREHAMMPRVSSVFTIHNIGYPGAFPATVLGRVGIEEKYFHMDRLEFYGKVSYLKAGIVYADRVTTVSPSYRDEILHTDLGFGFSGLLAHRGIDGIMNGIDYSEWDPSTDPSLPENYDADRPDGKAACKKALCGELGIRKAGLPLVGSVGRITVQKGYDIVAEAMDAMAKLGVNTVILGTGDPEIERELARAATRHAGVAVFVRRFDEDLARRIYAASDIFLMPSRYEPCGISQMIAMRYGAVPVVRWSGGLKDTVRDFNTADRDGTGFGFRNADPESMTECIKRVLCVFTMEDEWKRVMVNAMKARFSWDKTVAGYMKIYSDLAGEA